MVLLGILLLIGGLLFILCTCIIAGILVFAFIYGLTGLAGMTMLSGLGVFKIGRRLRDRIYRHRMLKLEREVTVFCPCSHVFSATPRFSNNWIVSCPRCYRSLRVDLSKKKKKKKSKWSPCTYFCDNQMHETDTRVVVLRFIHFAKKGCLKSKIKSVWDSSFSMRWMKKHKKNNTKMG